MPTVLDANAVLRYLLDDIEDQAARVRSVVEAGASTLPEVLCECVYVLQGRVYGFSRDEVSSALLALLDDVDCERRDAMRRALATYRETNLDFVDCILLAHTAIDGADVLTFDHALLARMRRATKPTGFPRTSE